MRRSQRPRSLKCASAVARLWDRGFETHLGLGCLSVVSVVCCQVAISAFGWSPVHRDPLDCGVSEYKREASNMRRPWSTRVYCAIIYTIMYTLTLRLLMSYIYMERLFLMFLGHTQRRSTVGRTPLDEWSARRRDLYLTTHDILKN